MENNINGNNFGNFILSIVKDFYDNTLLPNSKPQKNEWTIISSIIMQNNSQYKVISFSNGTKTLPNKNYLSKKFQIFDCHSEILTLRSLKFFLFNCFIYNYLQILKVKNSPIKKLLSPSEIEYFNYHKDFFDIYDFSLSKPKIKPSVHFHLYISSPPCGDCSINDSLIFGAKTLDECITFYNSEDIISKNNITINKKVNEFRTKSIRNNFKKEVLSFSLSCSDKIMLKIISGFQGKYLSMLIDTIYISSIVISNKEGIYNLTQCKNGINPFKRNVISSLKENEFSYLKFPEIYFIDKDIESVNGSMNRKIERNAQPFSFFWFFPSTVQKIDPVTGLKSGCRIDRINDIDNLRATISNYDLCNNILTFLCFYEECSNDNKIYFQSYKNITEKLKRKILNNKNNNNQLDIIDLFNEIISMSKEDKIKKNIVLSNVHLKEFKEIKSKILNAKLKE